MIGMVVRMIGDKNGLDFISSYGDGWSKGSKIRIVKNSTVYAETRLGSGHQSIRTWQRDVVVYPEGLGWFGPTPIPTTPPPTTQPPTPTPPPTTQPPTPTLPTILVPTTEPPFIETPWDGMKCEDISIEYALSSLFD